MAISSVHMGSGLGLGLKLGKIKKESQTTNIEAGGPLDNKNTGEINKSCYVAIPVSCFQLNIS